MNLIIRAFVLATLFSASSAHARGDWIGNGGGLWTCSVAGKMTSAELVDLYEAHDQYPLKLITTTETDPAKIAQERLMFLAGAAPDFVSEISKYLDQVKAGLFPTRGELTIIDDVIPKIRPPASDCAGGKWEYVQFANFDDQQLRILVQKDLWEGSLVPPLSKGALLWHEAVYRRMRQVDGDTFSSRARQVVGLVFSDLGAGEMKSRIDSVLKPSVPPPPTSTPVPPPPAAPAWVCRMINRLDLGEYLGYAPTEKQARLKAKAECQAHANPFHCQEFDVDCDQLEANPNAWLCTTENGLNAKTYEGYGRSKVEAEQRSHFACGATGLAPHCRPSSCEHQ